jgi:hypothetical protein
MAYIPKDKIRMPTDSLVPDTTIVLPQLSSGEDATNKAMLMEQQRRADAAVAAQNTAQAAQAAQVTTQAEAKARQGYVEPTNTFLPDQNFDQNQEAQAAAGQGGFGLVTSGNREMIVGPGNAATTTNFATGRDIPGPVATLEEATERARQASIKASQPATLAPNAAEPVIHGLQNNAQVKDASYRAAGTVGNIDPTTGQPTLDAMTVYRLGLQAKQGGKAGAQAQQTLLENGITASSDILTNTPANLSHQQMQILATNPNSLPPDKRKVLAADQARANTIMTQRQNATYAAETRAIEEATRLRKVGKEEADLAHTQALTAQTTQKTRMDALTAPLDYEIKKAELQNKVDTHTASVAEQKMLDDILAGVTQPAPAQQITSDENALLSTTDLEKVKIPYNQVRAVAAENNISPAVADAFSMGELTHSFASPVELMQAVDVNLKEGTVPTVVGVEVNAYTQEAQDTFSENIEPEKAVKKIAADSGLDPTDANYAQSILNISAAVMKVYDENGKAALPEIQAGIQQKRIQNRQTIEARYPALEASLKTPGGIIEVIKDSENAATQAAKLYEQTQLNTKAKQLAPGVKEKWLESYGLNNVVFSDPTTPEIEQMVINHLIKLSPKSEKYLTDQLNAETKDPGLQRFLDGATLAFREGHKSARAEVEQKQKAVKAEQDAIIKENLVNKLNTSFYRGQPVTFLQTEQGIADQAAFDAADDNGKALTAAKAARDIKLSLLPEGNQEWQALTPTSKVKVMERIDDAVILSEDEIYKKYNVLSKDDFVKNVQALQTQFGLLPKAKPGTTQTTATEPPVMTPEEVKAAPARTPYLTTDGRRGIAPGPTSGRKATANDLQGTTNKDLKAAFKNIG